MTISEGLLPEFDSEMATTRKMLERVPEDKYSWKPHEKSGTMGWLAAHIAALPGLATRTMQHDEFDFAPGGVRQAPAAPPNSAKELLEKFDTNAAAGRAAIAGAGDAEFAKTWTLLNNGQKIFAMPKVACLRRTVLSHIIHHRAQLGLYLRLNNVPLPATYGPSADEM
jgi:uncharacterized damage-inducible protein DinB